MEWSTSLERVVVLKLYLGPEPEVASFVREQLITDEEEAAVRRSINNVAKGEASPESVYGEYLTRSSLNVKRVLLEVGMKSLAGAVFDLNLGDLVRRMQLSRFSEVHEARELVEGFVWKWRGGPVGTYSMGSIWWDGIDDLPTEHEWWTSVDLERDPDFLAVLRRWLEDNDGLQSWLDNLGESPALVNNGGSGEGPVFSACVAFQVVGLAEVRSVLTEGRKYLTKHQSQGRILDLRRRNDFREKPSWFIEECGNLGLFETKMPRFSQLFFYDFSVEEICEKEGQLAGGRLLLRRAAAAQGNSNVRLESKSGISEVWYRCLEGKPETSGKESTSLEQNGKLRLLKQPGLRVDHMELFINKLGWVELHGGVSAARGATAGSGRGEEESGIEDGLLQAGILEEEAEMATEDYVPSSVPEERELGIRLFLRDCR